MPTEKDPSLYASYLGGPVNYGDPDSKQMSDGERGSIFSKFVQEKTIGDLCNKEWRVWRQCLASNKEKWFTGLRCRPVYTEFTNCQNRYVTEPELLRKLEEEYLQARSAFRKTGIGHRYMTREQILEFLEQK